ncbi:MAG: transcription-repair coupling factor, partial [Clostridia bacterium]|nr:transcription-repair coupling factor [Clostridia bacterium]
MNELNCLFTPLNELDDYKRFIDCAARPGTLGLFGLDDSQRLHMIAAAANSLGRPVIIITPSEQASSRCIQDLEQLLPGKVMEFPSREVSFIKTAASSRELNMRRLNVMGRAVSGDVSAIVASADALMHRLMPREVFTGNVIKLKDGMTVNPIDLIRQLTQAGYERVDMVEGRGQCALRGGILDVYPVGIDNAVRVEFFDDEIDSIRDFDALTQRSISRRDEVEVYPASEVILTGDEAKTAAEKLSRAVEIAAGINRAKAAANRQQMIEREFDLIPYEQFLKLVDDDEQSPQGKPSDGKSPLERGFSTRIDALRDGRMFTGADSMITLFYKNTQTIFDYLDSPIIVFDQPDRDRERCENRYLEFEEHFKLALDHGDALPVQGELLLRYSQILPALENHTIIAVASFAKTFSDFKFTSIHKFEGLGATNYQGNLKELSRDIASWNRDGWRICLLSGGVARGQRLNRQLFEENIDAPFLDGSPAVLEKSHPVIIPATITRGFRYPAIKLCVLSQSDIYGSAKQRSSHKASSGDKISALTDLRVGDYVVHENHGIGRYMGTVRLSSEGTYRDFLHIQYEGSDKLYVPTDQLDRVQKYIGSQGETPKLNRLSGADWQRQKAKVQKAAQDIAQDLIKLYSARAATPGFAYSPDTPWQRQFEDAFEYEETPDQLQAIEDIKRDMESTKTMDRLLCGDVGYGKTEVALRAIFKAVMDGKQAALLAPTTILVQQHYATMLRRFDGFPVHVETLSRFRTASEQKKTLERLAAGEVDVVIGTHRLLAKDVTYKDLGLLVVDEEQRFGVKHKESIKKYRKSIDVLTLSATPIPRTLHMSMVGIRDMSLLTTPPEERYPVQTYVVEYSDGLIRDAILRELARGGQVYVLYNRVSTIEIMFARLKKLVPEARIAVGHGQMREHALEDVMLDFYEGKYNVLLSTTIIEAGLDVPRANTLIVCDADRFGLSQLYQLRGRVGRSNRLAYAFLTVNPGKVLTESADKRLAAIRDFTEFGSGFRVAMRDLEIRGTGNLLGSEQSGHMASVGYDLYIKMIESAVRSLRGSTSLGDIQTKVELKVDAYLPGDYVENDVVRVEVYKKIASIRNRDDREDLIEELIDRFGDI